jgi:hypothetical protein
MTNGIKTVKSYKEMGNIQKKEKVFGEMLIKFHEN